jgi:Holliday junction resolvase RusA-like endonuclease
VIEFTVPGDAISFGTMATAFKRGGQTVRGTRKTTAAADWQAEVRRCAAEAMGDGTMMEGPVAVLAHCRFALPESRYLKRSKRPGAWKVTKPDGDKIMRLIMDALETVAYPHDAQVAAQFLVKTVGEQGEPAQTSVLVAPLPKYVGTPTLGSLFSVMFSPLLCGGPRLDWELTEIRM